MALDVDTSAAPSDAGRAHPRPWLRAMGRAAAVAADTNGTDHCLGPLALVVVPHDTQIDGHPNQNRVRRGEDYCTTIKNLEPPPIG